MAGWSFPKWFSVVESNSWEVSRPLSYSPCWWYHLLSCCKFWISRSLATSGDCCCGLDLSPRFFFFFLWVLLLAVKLSILTDVANERKREWYCSCWWREMELVRGKITLLLVDTVDLLHLQSSWQLDIARNMVQRVMITVARKLSARSVVRHQPCMICHVPSCWFSNFCWRGSFWNFELPPSSFFFQKLQETSLLYAAASPPRLNTASSSCHYTLSTKDVAYCGLHWHSLLHGQVVCWWRRAHFLPLLNAAAAMHPALTRIHRLVSLDYKTGNVMIIPLLLSCEYRTFAAAIWNPRRAFPRIIA